MGVAPLYQVLPDSPPRYDVYGVMQPFVGDDDIGQLHSYLDGKF